MSLPETPQWIKLKEATEDDLHRMMREHRGFLGVMDKIIGRVKMRSRSLDSEISKLKDQAALHAASRS